MSDVPSKLWLSQSSGRVWYGHAESTKGHAVFYHIPPAMIERIQRCVAMKEKDAADAWHHVWYAALSDLLTIIEGEA